MSSGFDQYYDEAVEPGRRERAYAWATAIGLQDVDGLKPSKHLYETARRHIEGEITQEEARRIVDEYYETKDGHDLPRDTQEADKVAARMIAGSKPADSVAHLHRKEPGKDQKLPIDLEKLPIRAPTKRHILLLWQKFGLSKTAFGPAQVVEAVGIKDRAARNLISLMRETHMVVDVQGLGKGKVRFAAPAKPGAALE